jgi:hypothetical protein
MLPFGPARPEPQDQPPAADLVDRVGHLREQRRIPEAGAGDERAEFDPPGGGGERGQQGPALPGADRAAGVEPEVHQQVIAEPEGIEALTFRELRHRQEVAPARYLAVQHQLPEGEEKAELEPRAARQCPR